MLLRARIGSLALALGPAGAFLAPHSRPGVIGAGSPALRHALAPHHSISLPVHRPRPARLGAGAGAAMQAEGIVLAAGVVDAVQAQLSALTLDDIAGGLFAVSLFPYLGFLYHLGRPENKTPELGLFGFKFLLAFVAASTTCTAALSPSWPLRTSSSSLAFGVPSPERRATRTRQSRRCCPALSPRLVRWQERSSSQRRACLGVCWPSPGHTRNLPTPCLSRRGWCTRVL